MDWRPENEGDSGKGTQRWQKERESCCFLCSLSFRASGGNECNAK